MLAAIAVAASMLPGAAAAGSSRAATGHVQLELISAASEVQRGTTHFALRQKIASGWHTYWRNPGDSGFATKLTWTLPKGWRAGDFVWAAPERTIAAGLMSYVYSHEVLLPVPVFVPASEKEGTRRTLKVKVDLVVCSDVCIPESATLTMPLTVQSGAPKVDPSIVREIQAALNAAPRPAKKPALFDVTDNRIDLLVSDPSAGSAPSAYFYPYEPGIINQAAPQQVEARSDGLRLRLAAGEGARSNALQSIAGVLALPNGKSIEVTARRHAIDTGGTLFAVSLESSDLTLLIAASMAFLGGLILNLMPCVFPILSIKVTSLAKYAADSKVARREGMAFFAGVFSTFALLAAGVIFAQAAGAQLGWGFQLQSPGVVLVLSLLLFTAGLNLSGVFEFGMSLQGVGSSLAAKPNWTGAFFTGALAVVVATPCTAPLMAPAIAWAATQKPLTAAIVFAALAVGFALPFVGLSFAPRLLGKLPKPGPWMGLFKGALAFPLYASAAWLAWVFVLQQGADALPGLFATALFIATAAWCWGLAQRGLATRTARVVAVVAAMAAIPIGASAAASDHAGREASARGISSPGTHEKWSPARVEELRREGRPVLVDFTAAWCITCQVNKRIVLSSDAVRSAMRRTQTAYLEADWTTADPVVTKELARFNRVGVPLYVLYDRAGKPRVLSQILTVSGTEEAIDQANRPDPSNPVT